MSLAVIFPGQGSQEVGMGTDFIQGEDKEWFEDVCSQLSFPLEEMLVEGPAEKLARTKYTQPAMFTVAHLIYRYVSRQGLEAEYFAGHSLGEYNALVAAGWASFEDMLPVVVARGKAMDEQAQKVEGGLAAVLKLDPEPLEELCAEISEDPDVEGTVEVALFNSPGQSVVSGSDAAISAVVDKAKDAGALKAVALDVSGPWHSQYMADAQQPLRTALEQVDWTPGKPVVPNVSGELLTSGTPVEYLIDQLVKPVNWVKSMQTLFAAGVDTFVEVGPGDVASGLVKRTARKADASPDVYQTDNLEQTKQTLEEVL